MFRPTPKVRSSGVGSTVAFRGRNNNNISKKVMETVWGNKSCSIAMHLEILNINFILKDAISQFSSDKALIHSASLVSYSVSTSNKKRGTLDMGELEQIASVLETFLYTTSDLPAGVVAYVHTYLGLIRQQQERFGIAIESLIKALWIRRSAGQSFELIAVASHRLGVAYSLAENYTNAKAALKQAIEYYARTGLSEDHEFVVLAKNQLFDIKTRSSRASTKKLIKAHSMAERKRDGPLPSRTRYPSSFSEARLSYLTDP